MVEAEEVLIEYGVVRSRSSALKKVIGCIGCRWHATETEEKEPIVCTADIVKCTGVGQPSVNEKLRWLQSSGVIVGTNAHREGKGGRPRIYYSPGDNDAATDFYMELEYPEVCPIDIHDT
jgi:hypothetical protein